MLLIRIIALLFIYLTQVSAYKTIIDALSEDERFSTLVNHIQELRMVPLINQLESGTLFAPDNDAFSKAKDQKVDRSVLLYHLIKKGMTTNDFYNGQLRESLYVRPGYLGPDNNKEGQRIKVTTASKDKIFINQAKIITKDIQVNNETYIQAIDRVLEPPSLLGNYNNCCAK